MGESVGNVLSLYPNVGISPSYPYLLSVGCILWDVLWEGRNTLTFREGLDMGSEWMDRENNKLRKEVISWGLGACVREPLARYETRELYECYCKDAGRPSWPAAGAVSLAMFGRAIREVPGVVKRKAGRIYIIGLQPKSLLPKQDATI